MTLPDNTPRLQVRGYFGETSHTFLSLNILAADVWLRALRQGDVSGLVRYPLFGGESDPQPGDWEGQGKAPAIGLSYSPSFDDAMHDPTTWIPEKAEKRDGASWVDDFNAGSSTLQKLPNPFGSGAGLFQSDGSPDRRLAYRSPFTIDPNRPFTLRFYSFKPENDSGAPNPDTLEFWWDIWKLIIKSGSARLLRYASTYINDEGKRVPISVSQCQALEVQLEALEASDMPSQADEEQINAIRHQIYEIDQSIAFRGQGDLHRGSRGTTITFIPAPCGFLLVETDGGGKRRNGTLRSQAIEIPSITRARQPGTLWGASPLRIRSSGLALEYQAGFPNFSHIGKIKLGEYSQAFDIDGAGGLPIVGRADRAPLLPGTNVTFSNVPVKENTQPPFVTITGPDGRVLNSGNVSGMFATLTSDGRYTPFLYAAQAYLLPGPRNGSDAFVWDSADHLDNGGNPPIREVAPQLENGEGGRRSLCHLVLRCHEDEETGAIELGTLPELRDRLCDIGISANNTKLFSKSLIRSATWNDVETIRKDAPGAPEIAIGRRYPHAWTEISLDISDPNALLDEDLIIDDPVLDGMTLAAAWKKILRGGGWKTSEILMPDPSLGGDLGRVLPSAVGGELPAVRPTVGTARGTFLRGLFDKYGLGRRFWWNHARGAWCMGFPSTTIKANFSGAATTPLPYRAETIDEVEDTSDFFNAFYVEGARDPQTNAPIALRDYLFESFRDSKHPCFIGRVKRCPDVKDDGLRAKDDVAYAMRSLFRRYARPPRFVQFTCGFIPNLYPLDRITLDGELLEIERVPQISLATRDGYGQMTIVARRLSLARRI